MEILASQFRAARALLGAEQETVAEWAQLDRQKIGGLETARFRLYSSAAERLQRTYEKNDVEFIPPSETQGAGVRWRKPGREDKFRGAQFRAARAMANMSIRDIQEVGGVNRNFIARLEGGKFGAVNLESIRKLEAVLREKNVVLTPEGETWGAGVSWSAVNPFPAQARSS